MNLNAADKPSKYEFYVKACDYVKDAIFVYLDDYQDPSIRVLKHEDSGTFVHIIKERDSNLIVFRGTDEILDWRMNLKVWPSRNYFGFKVHRGFAKIHEQIYEILKDEISKLLESDPHKPIYFVGHSLGGALAELFAIVYASVGAFQTGYFTFGKPNVFRKSERFKDFFEMPNIAGKPAISFLDYTVSVVNPCDPVTVIPHFLYGPFPWQTKLVTDRKTKMVYVNPDKDFFKLLKLLESGKNHSLSEYKKRLLNCDFLIFPEA